MMYADFAYYTNEYGGTILTDQTDFERAAKEASLAIDIYTDFAIRGQPDIQNEPMLKNCCCVLCDKMHVRSQQIDVSGRIAKSETVAEHSVTYEVAIAKQADFDASIANLILTMLGGLDLFVSALKYKTQVMK